MDSWQSHYYWLRNPANNENLNSREELLAYFDRFFKHYLGIHDDCDPEFCLDSSKYKNTSAEYKRQVQECRERIMTLLAKYFFLFLCS